MFLGQLDVMKRMSWIFFIYLVTIGQSMFLGVMKFIMRMFRIINTNLLTTWKSVLHWVM